MKIALIEMTNSHDECLYSQVKIIRTVPNVHLTLICTSSLKENIEFIDSVDRKVFYEMKKGIHEWIFMFKLWHFCRKENFDKIIFNTAQGILTGRLMKFPYKKRTNFYGILHETKKLGTSFSQNRISKKIKHYFILNDYLKNNTKYKFTVSVFYPIFFPPFTFEPVDKKIGDTWICVPGQVELKRRDYKALFESIELHGINENVKILLLGRYGHSNGDGAYIQEQISRLNLEDNILIWENFIPVVHFHTMVNSSDYILPLIHEGDASGDLYQNQISGAFNLAAGYKKPLVLEKHIFDKCKFSKAVTYDVESIMKTLNELKPNDTANIYYEEKMDFEIQRKNYLESIGIKYNSQIEK